MKQNYTELSTGYLETIQKGINGVRRFSSGISRGTGTRRENLDRLKKEIETEMKSENEIKRVEKIAREKLGFLKENERLFVDSAR